MNFSDAVYVNEPNSVNIFFLGQAGFIIKNKSGELLAIDPYLSDCVERVENNGGFKRLLPKLISPQELDLDVLVCTHHHRDHYDVDSVPSLIKANTKLLCPNDCEDDVIEEHIDRGNVVFVEVGSNHQIGDYALHFINCDHGEQAPLAVGVIIEVDGYRVLYIGDSCLHLDWKNKYLQFGTIDLLIAPINGAFGNLNSQECMQLAKLIKPKLTIPCHFGMFKAHGGNPNCFANLMQTEKLDYLIMSQGQKLNLQELLK